MGFKKHCKVVLGSYVEVHNKTTLTNSINPMAHECIYLIPNGNMQGSQKVFCLNTVGLLNIIKIINMLAPDQFIRNVYNWYKKSKIY